MRKLSLILMCAAVALQASAWKPIFVGHRGCNKGVENTAEAYRNGVDFYHYTGLECDVRVTSDGEYVISHDETTNRIGGSLTVANATLAQLKAENYSQTRSGSTYTGTICTMAEYLDICVEKGAFPVIELKWTTGINNSDMSKFPGLAALIEEKGLTSKAVILTSMKNSLEYVRTNYPALQCQFLCNANWATNFDWIVKWKLTPSIEAGCFDKYTVKKFHDVGLPVAVWTVDSKANYQAYGEMGVAMFTCNSLVPADMPELADIDWDAIVPPQDALEVTVDTIFGHTMANNTMPENFPTGASGKYASAQQGAITSTGLCFANNYTTSELVMITPEGKVSAVPGTTSHGTCLDDAENLILRNDGITKTPNKLVVYPKADINAQPVNITFELSEAGQTNFITACGDILSSEGGYVFFFQNALSYVTTLYIANGEVQEIIKSGATSFASSTAGMVFPIDGTPNKFIYQVRNQGYNLYNGTDKGKYVTGSLNTTQPNSNSSVGGAYFVLEGHEMFLYTSGTNYNGGFSVRDMSANNAAVANIAPLGTGGYTANPSCGSFFRVIPEGNSSVLVYDYTMGNGYACYRIYTENYDPNTTGVKDVTTTVTKVSTYPNPTSDMLNVNAGKTINEVNVYDLAGKVVAKVQGNGENAVSVDLSSLAKGIYVVNVDGVSSKVIKK
ncbi:MAG: T9SS type A sorting domain-containing protein [Bacteroidales bacterium]|nr:T9SS type A sorting domain-containing protein [Candidatus Sodaliphilus fimicaballi]